MVTHSITLPADLATRLERAARSSSRTEAAFILDILEQHLPDQEKAARKRKVSEDEPDLSHPILRFAGSWSDMPEEAYRDFHQELEQRRRHAGKRRRSFDAGID